VDSFAKHLGMDTFDEDLEMEGSEPTMQITPADFESTEDSDASEPQFHLKHATDQQASIFREVSDYQVLAPKIAPVVSPILGTQVQKAVMPYMPTPSHTAMPQVTTQGYAVAGNVVFPRQRGDIDFDQASINFIPLPAPNLNAEYAKTQSEYAKTQPMPVSQQQIHALHANGMNSINLNGENRINLNGMSPMMMQQPVQHQQAPSFLDELRTPPPLYVPNAQIEQQAFAKQNRKHSWNLLILIALFLVTTIFFAIQWVQGLSSKSIEQLKICQEQAISQELVLLQKSIEICEDLSKQSGIDQEVGMKSMLWLTQSLLWFYEGKRYENPSFVNEPFSQVLLDHAKNLIEDPKLQAWQSNGNQIEPNAQLMKIQFLMLKNRLALAEDLIKEYQEQSQSKSSTERSMSDAKLDFLRLKLADMQEKTGISEIEWIQHHLNVIQTPYELYFAYLTAFKLNQIALADQIKGIFLQKYPQHSLRLKFNTEMGSNPQASLSQTQTTQALDREKDKKTKASQPIQTHHLNKEKIDSSIAETRSQPKQENTEEIELIAAPSSISPTPSNAVSTNQQSTSNPSTNKTSEQSSENHTKTSGQSLDQLIKLASQALENGHSKQAEQYLHQAQKISSSNPKVMTLLGWCAMSTYQYGIAEARFRSALDIQSSNEDALYGLGSAYEKNQKKQQAIETFEKYLQIYSGLSKAQGVRKKLEKLKN
jgi:tetratricopeptide (TPR) repeat protein